MVSFLNILEYEYQGDAAMFYYLAKDFLWLILNHVTDLCMHDYDYDGCLGKVIRTPLASIFETSLFIQVYILYITVRLYNTLVFVKHFFFLGLECN